MKFEMINKVLVIFLLFFSHPVFAQVNSIQAKVDSLFQLLERGKNQDYLGEPVSQLEHALQCADLARQAKADDEVIIAALLHDIGHMVDVSEDQKMGKWGVKDHELVGKEYLQTLGFSKKITDLVEGHISAKRYLIYKNPTYAKKLSPASIETLKYQGGMMSPEEAKEFEQSPWFKEKLKLREWDERAKEVNWHGPQLDSYKLLIVQLLTNQDK